MMEMTTMGMWEHIGVCQVVHTEESLTQTVLGIEKKGTGGDEVGEQRGMNMVVEAEVSETVRGGGTMSMHARDNNGHMGMH
jgi:hypothetical protein